MDPAHAIGLKGTARKSFDRRTQRGEDPFEERDIPDVDEVKRYYKDYMQCLYAHISEEIQGKTGSWLDKRVVFIFSLPCTFKKPSIAQALRTLLRDSGFGEEGEKHNVEFGLTEPEASAVFTIKDTAVQFQEGTTILVCDAGGGTTDLAVLQTVSKGDDRPELSVLVVVEGKNVGSTNIDKAFENLVDERLLAAGLALGDNTAWYMMHSSEFLLWKRIFGHDDSNDLESFPVPVPGVQSNFHSIQANILNGKMRFSQ